MNKSLIAALVVSLAALSAQAQESTALTVSTEEKFQQVASKFQQLQAMQFHQDSRLKRIEETLEEVKTQLKSHNDTNDAHHHKLTQLQDEVAKMRQELILALAEERMQRAKEYTELLRRLSDLTQDTVNKQQLNEHATMLAARTTELSVEIAKLKDSRDEMQVDIKVLKSPNDKAGPFEKVLRALGEAVDSAAAIIPAALPFLKKP
jgi:peptidoglycan hydrolase CwlO-like protein